MSINFSPSYYGGMHPRRVCACFFLAINIQRIQRPCRVFAVEILQALRSPDCDYRYAPSQTQQGVYRQCHAVTAPALVRCNPNAPEFFSGQYAVAPKTSMGAGTRGRIWRGTGLTTPGRSYGLCCASGRGTLPSIEAGMHRTSRRTCGSARSKRSERTVRIR